MMMVVKLAYIVWRRLAVSILLPNPKRYLNDSRAKVSCGRQRPICQSRIALIVAEETDWKTKLHTPKPLYAIARPIMPDNDVLARLIFACDLKSTAAFNFACCTMVSELMKRLILQYGRFEEMSDVWS